MEPLCLASALALVLAQALELVSELALQRVLVLASVLGSSLPCSSNHNA
jgi:hypothetical protein